MSYINSFYLAHSFSFPPFHSNYVAKCKRHEVAYHCCQKNEEGSNLSFKEFDLLNKSCNGYPELMSIFFYYAHLVILEVNRTQEVVAIMLHEFIWFAFTKKKYYYAIFFLCILGTYFVFPFRYINTTHIE